MSNNDKITFRVTLTGTYSVSPEILKSVYGTADPNEAAKIDQDDFNGGPDMVFEALEEISTIKVEAT